MDKIKVFLSWSGDTSRQVAKILKEWLPVIFQQIDPWMSEKDIEAGARWQEEILKNLSESHFGIICITPDNLSSKWLHFEAGALVKHLPEAVPPKVVPLLYKVSLTELEGPLSMFQAKYVLSKDDMLSVIESIYNSFEGEKTSLKVIRKSFKSNWGDLQKELKNIKPIPPKDKKKDQIEITEILENVLGELKELRFEIYQLREVVKKAEENRPGETRSNVRMDSLFDEILKYWASGLQQDDEGNEKTPVEK